MVLPVACLALNLASWLVPPSLSTQQEKGKQAAFRGQFLVFGTGFAEPGFVLPGAEILVRRVGEHKVRWQARSDRRGEFAVRVPNGARYQIAVSAKGYQEQARELDATLGNREDGVFRLRPARRSPGPPAGEAGSDRDEAGPAQQGKRK
jgi:hypothetical protein